MGKTQPAAKTWFQLLLHVTRVF